MWLDRLPLLTKGPFALMYGGEDILSQVKIISSYILKDLGTI